jgi:hypothetical protein
VLVSSALVAVDQQARPWSAARRRCDRARQLSLLFPHRDVHPRQCRPVALSRQREPARIERQIRQASCRCDSTSPLCGSFSSEDPQCASGDEVALRVEGFVNRGVHAEEALLGHHQIDEICKAFRACKVTQQERSRRCWLAFGRAASRSRRHDKPAKEAAGNAQFCRRSSDG